MGLLWWYAGYYVYGGIHPNSGHVLQIAPFNRTNLKLTYCKLISVLSVKCYFNFLLKLLLNTKTCTLCLKGQFKSKSIGNIFLVMLFISRDFFWCKLLSFREISCRDFCIFLNITRLPLAVWYSKCGYSPFEKLNNMSLSRNIFFSVSSHRRNNK